MDSAGRSPAVISALGVKERMKMAWRSKSFPSGQSLSLEYVCVHAHVYVCVFAGGGARGRVGC